MLALKLYPRPRGSDMGSLFQYPSSLDRTDGAVGWGLDAIQKVDEVVAMLQVFDPALSVASYVPYQ